MCVVITYIGTKSANLPDLEIPVVPTSTCEPNEA